jgi:hypothetical protein
MVMFLNRENKWVERPLPADDETLPPLPAEAYEDAREAAPAMTSIGSKANGVIGGQAAVRQLRRGLRRLLPEPPQAGAA